MSNDLKIGIFVEEMGVTIGEFLMPADRGYSVIPKDNDILIKRNGCYAVSKTTANFSIGSLPVCTVDAHKFNSWVEHTASNHGYIPKYFQAGQTVLVKTNGASRLCEFVADLPSNEVLTKNTLGIYFITPRTDVSVVSHNPDTPSIGAWRPPQYGYELTGTRTIPGMGEALRAYPYVPCNPFSQAPTDQQSGSPVPAPESKPISLTDSFIGKLVKIVGGSGVYVGTCVSLDDKHILLKDAVCVGLLYKHAQILSTYGDIVDYSNIEEVFKNTPKDELCLDDRAYYEFVMKEGLDSFERDINEIIEGAENNE